jgi:ABC-type multidrug transport system ATPase subunit
MSGKAFLIVGGTGSGKTTFTKKALAKVHPNARFIYDVNNEYKEFFDYPLKDFDEFIYIASTLKNAFIVFEEATIFLNNKSSNKILIDILVRKRHTNNTIFLVFHSLRSIPRYVFDLSNILVLHKTNDNENFVEKRFENEIVTDAFLKIKNASWIKSREGKIFSPSTIIKLS